jgi:hypothetical protein
MRIRSLFALVALGAVFAPGLSSAQENRLYTLTDTIKVVFPSPGRALLVVTRELVARAMSTKEELVYLDESPLGFLPEKTALAREIEPGFQRIWALGSGANAETWLDVKPNRIYLLRMRQTEIQGNLYSDFVRETPRGYRKYAIERGIRISRLTEKGTPWMAQKLGQYRQGTPPPADTARAAALRRNSLPIVREEARYQDPSLDKNVAQADDRIGRFEMDAKAIRFKDAKRDLTVPLDGVIMVQYAGTFWDTAPAWLRVTYRQGEADREALFAAASYPGSTAFYNAVFGVLEDKLTVGLE